MTAQELRIGNYVEYFIQDPFEAKPDYWDITQIDAQDIVFIDSYPNTPDYRPIPITEEWLVKLGFAKRIDYGDKIFYDKEHFYVCFDDEDLSFGIVKNNEYTCLIYDEQFFSFIHQLQNAFFALTGKELIIKP